MQLRRDVNNRYEASCDFSVSLLATVLTLGIHFPMPLSYTILLQGEIRQGCSFFIYLFRGGINKCKDSIFLFLIFNLLPFGYMSLIYYSKVNILSAELDKMHFRIFSFLYVCVL